MLKKIFKSRLKYIEKINIFAALLETLLRAGVHVDVYVKKKLFD